MKLLSSILVDNWRSEMGNCISFMNYSVQEIVTVLMRQVALTILWGMRKALIKFYNPVRIWVLDKYRPWKWWYDIIASDILRHENGNLNRNSNFSSYFQMTSKVHGKFVFINILFTDGSRKSIFCLEKTNHLFFFKYWIPLRFFNLKLLQHVLCILMH